ncbi:TolC family protein [Yunchengibacter salinarum]|uniref:TolC family protein n=1 Tax=Yunchengibacter salinarum TaxID=3133399 RepID=UPI0035B68C88
MRGLRWISGGCAALMILLHATPWQMPARADVDLVPLPVDVNDVARPDPLIRSSGRRADSPTALEDVLASLHRHAPVVAAALLRADSAAGRQLAAQGAFDTRVSGRAHGRMSGFYDGKVIESEISRRVAPMNATVFAQYNISDGTFPVYEDEWATLSGGEARLGVSMSLLRNRAIDPARLALVQARTNMAEVRGELAMTLAALDAAAVRAYADWLFTVRAEAVYRDLLTLAEKRQKALANSIKQGQQARISLRENRQLLLSRSALVTRAHRDRIAAEERLALYFRDKAGRPTLPRFQGDLYLPDAALDPIAANPDELVQLALNIRPDLQAISARMAAARAELDAADNHMLPRLDLKTYAARDFGNGSPTRAQTDTVVSLTFSVPLERRAARGAVREADAKLRQLRHQRRWLGDQVSAAIREARATIHAAATRLALRQEEVKVTQELVDVEQTRLRNGASDFFRINLAEANFANARIKALRARAALDKAYGTLIELLGDRQAVFDDAAPKTSSGADTDPRETATD